jgi:hypothetical protein
LFDVGKLSSYSCPVGEVLRAHRWAALGEQFEFGGGRAVDADDAVAGVLESGAGFGGTFGRAG